MMLHLMDTCGSDSTYLSFQPLPSTEVKWVGPSPKTDVGLLVANLCLSPVAVVNITGRTFDQPPILSDPHPVPICSQTGITVLGNTLGTDNFVIAIIYDVTNCDGFGYLGYDQDGYEIPRTPQTNLVFGLAWANMALKDLSRPDIADRLAHVDLQDCLNIENLFFRKVRMMRLRVDPQAGYGVKCPSQPFKRTTPPPETQPSESPKGFYYPHVSGCFVASAAYGSPFAPEVDFLRHIRDDVLTRTRFGERWFRHFHEHYYRISPAIAQQMREQPELARLIRFAIVEPLVRYLQMAQGMPDATLDGLPEPWASFLRDLRSGIEKWVSTMELPRRFDGISGLDATRELAVFLHYVLRTPERRAEYLAELEASGALPLRLDREAAAIGRQLLADSGRPETEIVRVLGAGSGPADTSGRGTST